MMKIIRYALRFYKKFSAYTLLNITGITIAILIAIFGILFFTVQLNYDSFHFAHVYRVHLGKEASAAKVFPALAEKLTDFSSISAATRLKKTTLAIQYNETRFSDISTYYVDGNFFDVLNYEVIAGNKKNLSAPNRVFISETLSRKITDNIFSLIGKTILIPKTNGYESYTVEGILKDTPLNSHLKFDMLVSYNSLDEGKPTFQYGWAFKGVDTYVKATEPIKLTSEETNKFLTEIKAAAQNNSIRPDEGLAFIPIREVHYLKNMIHDEKYGDKTQTLTLLILFVVLLITLVFNFYGSSLIISHFRTKSLKLKKIFGASSYRVFIEKLVENLMMFTAAIAIAWILFWLNEGFIFSTFNISRKTIYADPLVVLLSLSVIGIIFVVIPALQAYFYSKRIDIKGKLVVTRNMRDPFGKIAIIQVAISLILVIVSLGIYNQVRHIEGKNDLIETENIIVVDPPQRHDETRQYAFLKNEFSKLSFVKKVSLSNTVPFNDYAQLWWGVRYNGVENFENEYAVVDADNHFFEVYDIDLISGYKGESEKDVVVNRKFVDKFLAGDSVEHVINQHVVLRSDTFNITGVAEDYYHLSSKSSILPSVYKNKLSDGVFLSVKFGSSVTASEISEIEKLWRRSYPEELFTYHVLADGFEKIVREDVRLLSIGSFLATLVCILALLALLVTISINLFKRQREFAIRKIIGASKMANIKLIYNEYLIGILIACFISAPLSKVTLDYFLNNYIDKTDLSLAIFLIPYLFFLLTSLTMIVVMYNRSERNTSLSEELNQ